MHIQLLIIKIFGLRKDNFYFYIYILGAIFIYNWYVVVLWNFWNGIKNYFEITLLSKSKYWFS